ncbi:MAG: DNA-3-methyladenine glycosylase [Acidobacteria bacterium]|nr:DNA-3-methyladenine glycosylase [Acidobacteriota bacterium]
MSSPVSTAVLPRRFYARPTVAVARDLLGAVLMHEDLAGRIVEVEAYLGEGDLAAHAAHGLTARTRVLFGPPGHAYVYFIYGVHHCLNVAAEPEGVAGCVLIRAVEPVAGLETMRLHRPAARRSRDLANGPGKLTRAFGIGLGQNGLDLTDPASPLRIHAGHAQPRVIETSPRIGISVSVDLPLRFTVAGSVCLSR